ncbi:patatin-like phospholipase family protein [Rickettsia endosymbiont of Pantilius tunicatus]|uniref:patatin-like phospholipase family protein n=1 Tax=Rickettsia endosymbiont of Pantilius tunicatus TaxID=3066267 RepID=UPI00376EE8FD
MTININNVENLVFSGGGVKVIAYAGALKALEETGHLSQIKKVAGTSGGAITALCVALGYNPEEIDIILKDIDFNKFADSVEPQYVISEWIKNFVTSIFNFLKPYTSYADQAIQFLSTYGIHPGNEVKSFLEDLVTKKGFSKDVTFKELNDSTTSKELYVVMTNLNTQYPEIISYKSAPNTKIVDCVHASGAFPFYFKPVEINGNSYVDGGIMKNYPIDIFDQGAKIVDDKTIGFKPINKELIDAYQQGREPQPFVKVNNAYNFGVAVAEAITSSDSMEALKNSYRSVLIDDLGISALQFDLTDTQKIDMITHGHDATTEFIQANQNYESSVLGQDSTESLAA